MSIKIDNVDHNILAILQKDSTMSIDDISDRVSLSRNACWRRIKQMETDGIIRKRVALLDPVAIGCPLTAMVLIRAQHHSEAWSKEFQIILGTMPEVVGAYRMTGELDYLLKVRIADMPAYDLFYKRLISKVSVSDISASFVMEELKETTMLPL